ncbi:hypothetical protein JCM17823_01240 [Halorubrum gandharaense]
MLLSIPTSFAGAFIYGTLLLGAKMADSNRGTMKDVSHTAPNDTSADSVWTRGRRWESEEEEEEEE